MPTADEQARYAWQVLSDWLAYDAEGRALLDRYLSDPEGEAGALRHWLRTHVNQAPPQLATYVHGGQVDQLVNIAHAGVVHYTTIHDASGWSLIVQARGLSRVLIVLGTILALAGFASFGYPIVNAFGNVNSGNAADRACRKQFPQAGQQQAECLVNAHSGSTGADFDATPWIPLGAGLFFAGAVLTTAGGFMIRDGRDRSPH